MLHLLAMIALIGMIDWGLQTMIPMTDQFKKIFHVVAVLAAVFIILQSTGLIAGHVDM